MSTVSTSLENLIARVKSLESAYQFGAGIDLCVKGLKEYPHSYELANNLGRYLLLQGRVPEALRIFQRLMRENPHDYMLDSNLLYYQHYTGERTGAEIHQNHLEWVRKWLGSGTDAPSRRRACPAANRKIKLGFVSPDFRRHPVSSFSEPLIRELDREQFEIHCYSRQGKTDAKTEQFQALADHWWTFSEADIEQAIQRIRHDNIDVLIDLAGHTPGHALKIFAARPAPMQITYLGYPNTTGLDAMDYRLVDRWSDPVGLTDPYHTEKLVRLPETAWCYEPPPEAVAADWAPAFKRNHRITFGSFNILSKLSDACLRAWGLILEKVPKSVLLLKSYAFHDLEGREVFLKRALTLGLPIERIEFVGGLPVYLHHQAYRMVDIALDTFPYAGTTTSCEALWMGVPVVTLAGDFHVTRVGASLLHQVALDELVAPTVPEYVESAVKLSLDPVRLQLYHSTLRQRMSASPLTDAPRFARAFGKTIENLLNSPKI